MQYKATLRNSSPKFSNFDDESMNYGRIMPEMAERRNGGRELDGSPPLPPSADGTIPHGPPALGSKKMESNVLLIQSIFQT